MMGFDQELDAILAQQGLALAQISAVLIELLPVGAVEAVEGHHLRLERLGRVGREHRDERGAWRDGDEE